MADRHRQSAFADFVLEQMADIPDVAKRSMFGGFGIYRSGLMFALIANEQLYFKADEMLAQEFTAMDLPPVVYTGKSGSTARKYHLAPEAVFEEAEQMARWSDKAYQCAVRAAAEKAAPQIRRSKR